MPTNIIDPVTNFAVGQLASGISAIATSLTLNNNASRFPDPSILGAYDCTLWDSSVYTNASLDPDAEIVRVTAKSGSVFTITRAQQGTSATAKNLSGHTYSLSISVTKKMFDDIELYFAPKASPIFSGNVTLTETTNLIGVNSSDGSDNKAITVSGGGAYGVARGSGIAVIGNEFSTIGGNLELLAGDSSISGKIMFYVGDGAGGALTAGMIERATGAWTLGTVSGVGLRAIYVGAISINGGNVTIANTNESTSISDFTGSITNAGFLINTEYTANAYTSGLFWVTSNDNATKPKAGIFMQETGAGTLLILGTSNSYSAGITSSISIDPNGNVACNSVSTSASTTVKASINIPHGSAPTSPVNGDFWTTTSGAFIRINGVTKTFTLT